MFENYYQVRDWLEEFIPLVYGKEELGLAKIENLLRLLGNPERKFKSIHVAGTAGKGSTSFYCAKLLQKLGFKVGLHISPHLIYIGERMQINGVEIEVKTLVDLINKIKPVVDQIKVDSPDLVPSYFEILVAASFLYFAQQKVDFAVVEVGLGGRLDATNVLLPEVSVITNIGLDHVELLGNTLSKIAFEKAGIIKDDVPVVTGAGGVALKVIADVAKKRQARLIKLDAQKEKNTSLWQSIPTNQKLAFLAVKVVSPKIEPFDFEDIFAEKFAGRFEKIDERVILDGAHNVDKIKYLISQLNLHKSDKIALVLAFKSGKSWKKMLKLIILQQNIAKIITTQYQAVTDTGVGSAVSADEIAAFVKSNWQIPVESIKNSQEAVICAIDDSSDSLVLVTGSLYLVGEATTLWKLPPF